MELRIAKPGRRRMKRGVGEIKFRRTGERLDVETGDFCCDREVVDEVEVLDAHFASRSSSSRS